MQLYFWGWIFLDKINCVEHEMVVYAKSLPICDIWILNMDDQYSIKCQHISWDFHTFQ